MLEFQALDIVITPKGLLFTGIQNPAECWDFDHIIGQEVIIRFGRFIGKYVVMGVERFAKAAPWKKGEMIGFLIQFGTLTSIKEL